MLTVSLFEGSINSEVFYQWVVQDLIKKLPNKSVIVLDNATFHKRQDIIDAFEQEGHRIVFLPPYSPDLNPIEKTWGLSKSIRRRENCTPDELFGRHMESHFIRW